MFKMIACSSIVDPWASVSYFQKGAPGTSGCAWRHMGGFWSMISGEDHQQRNTIRNPIIQVFHSYVQKDFGEDERNKDNQHGVELALLGFAR
jgi:hypothetical protein